MEYRLSGNSRVVYEQLRRMGGGCVSFGMLAIVCGCHRNTVRNIIQKLTSRGLISTESERGRPNYYEIP